MKSKLFFLVISLAVLCICSIAFAQEPPTHEEITLTTYYPAPYGEYNSLSVGDPGNGYLASVDGQLLVEGNVGIGTTEPGATLHIQGSDSNVLRISGDGSAGHKSLIGFMGGPGSVKPRASIGIQMHDDSGAGELIFINGPSASQTEKVRIDKNGNVGIGTASPGAKLELAGSDTVGVPLGIRFNYYDDDRPDIRNGVLAMGFGAGGSWWGGRFHIVGKGGMDPITGGNLLQDGIDGTHILTIDPATGEVYFVDGNVGIGTTSPATTLDINGVMTVRNTGDNSAIFFEAASNKTAQIGVQDDSDQGFYVFTNGQYRMSVNQNGNVGIGTTSPNHLIELSGGAYCDGTGDWMAGSDRAYKKDIDYDFKYGLDEIKQLKPVSFIHKEDKDNKRQIGFIAQDVIKVIPEVISGEEEAYGLSYGQLTAVLVRAIQEQGQVIEEQQKVISELRQEVNKIKENL